MNRPRLCWLIAATLAATAGCNDPNRLRVGSGAEDCPLDVPAGNGLRTNLYDAVPEPYPWMPLLSRHGERLGLSTGLEEFRVCEGVYRATWNHRYLWVRIKIDGREAWLNAGETELETFLAEVLDDRRRGERPGG